MTSFKSNTSPVLTPFNLYGKYTLSPFVTKYGKLCILKIAYKFLDPLEDNFKVENWSVGNALRLEMGVCACCACCCNCGWLCLIGLAVEVVADE